MNAIEKWHEVFVTDNPKQSSQIPVFIRILDINDHAPEFAMYYETFVCENAKSGQVNKAIINFINISLAGRSQCFACIKFCYTDIIFLLCLLTKALTMIFKIWLSKTL